MSLRMGLNAYRVMLPKTLYNDWHFKKWPGALNGNGERKREEARDSDSKRTKTDRFLQYDVLYILISAHSF